MGKWIFLVILMLVVYLAIKAGRRASSAKTAATPIAETMVACKSCGVHMPKGEALEIRGLFYCCKDHGASD